MSDPVAAIQTAAEALHASCLDHYGHANHSVEVHKVEARIVVAAVWPLAVTQVRAEIESALEGVMGELHEMTGHFRGGSQAARILQQIQEAVTP